jgi:hypothetical protein
MIFGTKVKKKNEMENAKKYPTVVQPLACLLACSIRTSQQNHCHHAKKRERARGQDRGAMGKEPSIRLSIR